MQHRDREILSLLAENEAAISRLYRAYADKFPSHKTFWEALADEETKHVSWIQKMGLEVDTGMIYINEGRFKPRPIEIMRGYIGDQLIRAQEEGLSLVDALSTAIDIELSLLERDYFEIFETDSATVKHTLMDLKNATEEHIKQVREAWESTRG